MLANLVQPGKEVVTVGKEVKARRLKKKERIALEKAAMLQKIAELEEYKAQQSQLSQLESMMSSQASNDTEQENPLVNPQLTMSVSEQSEQKNEPEALEGAWLQKHVSK